MWRRLAFLAVAAGLALSAGPALADFSACESAWVAKNIDTQIELYTLCLTKGGLGAQDRAGAYNNRGNAYLRKGDVERAMADFNRSIANDPRWGAGYSNRGRVHLSRNELEAAEADFDNATRFPPYRDWTDAYLLRGQTRARRANYKGALADFEVAAKRDRKLAKAYNMKAWLLATCPDASVRNGAAAVETALKAVQLEDAAHLRDTLAAAYAEAGRFDEAVAEQTKALEMARQAGVTLAGAEERLSLYQHRLPFREGPA